LLKIRWGGKAIHRLKTGVGQKVLEAQLMRVGGWENNYIKKRGE